MEAPLSNAAARKPYARPRLVVYGRLEALTLTEAENTNKNDMFNNFKTQ